MCIDVPPGQVHWFTGKRPTPQTVPCDHPCRHLARNPRVVAWGPDIQHYEIVECALCGCQAWRSYDGMLDVFYET